MYPIQVHPRALRLVKPGGAPPLDIPPPRQSEISEIVRVAHSPTQVVCALRDHSLVYYELEAGNIVHKVVCALRVHSLVYYELEAGNIAHKESPETGGVELSAVALSPPTGPKNKSKFMAVTCSENTWVVRIISLEAGPSYLQTVARQALGETRPDSLLFASAQPAVLFAGLANGVLVRVGMDTTTGSLLPDVRVGMDTTTGLLLPDVRTRVLGKRSVRLLPVQANGAEGVLALSSRAWLSHPASAAQGARQLLTPLS
ncbi:hypothetical protein T484DRAFT_1837635, partial [Baffinella frigidus]